MSVLVTISGADKESDEYQAAEKLKTIIQNSLPASVIGEIVLFASATLVGQAVKDVDLMMLGILQNYSLDSEFVASSGKYEKNKVNISSFCTTIEIKSHDISGIFRVGTDFYVKYGKNSHCVTEQSNKQKIATMNFFKRTLNASPYITNVIWFIQATNDDIDGLLQSDGSHMPSNVIGSDFEYSRLMQLLVLQKPPHKTQQGYIFDSSYNNCKVDDLKKALLLFSKTKEKMGELTRRRIEQITSRAFNNNLLIDTKGKLSIYRGRAGTGKTVGLIQTAISLVDSQQARVIILTYNKALVSDIRRLFAIAELPDMFETNCVSINTMHSYFYHLVNQILYDGKMVGTKYLEHYGTTLKELLEFLQTSDGAVEMVREICHKNIYLDWDYILIDEAQDWTNLERDIILLLFDKGKIIVADGGQQFVRNLDVCDWSITRERNNIKLKYCLRQKENIIKFINCYSKKLGVVGGKILSCDNMLGGKVIILGDENLFHIHIQELEKLRNSGNIPYDMLYLVPHKLVKKNWGESGFALTHDFYNNGIKFWDGTNERNREEYPIDLNEVRLLQYNSARGLEGWSVFCLDFDTFIEEKFNEYSDDEHVNSLLLESSEERKLKYIFNWAMIPLTRAIDTLIITLKDKESETGKILKEISEECLDYVTWM